MPSRSSRLRVNQRHLDELHIDREAETPVELIEQRGLLLLLIAISRRALSALCPVPQNGVKCHVSCDMAVMTSNHSSVFQETHEFVPIFERNPAIAALIFAGVIGIVVAPTE
jgi:hypothetical protein